MILMCFLVNVINFIDCVNFVIVVFSICVDFGFDVVGMGFVLSVFFWIYVFL